MTGQIPLNLTPEPSSFEAADFIVSDANAAAFTALDNWSHSQGAVLALTGAGGSGKSHLAHIWAEREGARRVEPGESLLAVGDFKHFLLEDVDRAGFDDVQVFHIFNWAKEQRGRLLMTSRVPPNRLGVSLPDLRSRLATVTVLEISPPDDMLLTLLITKLFADRQIRVDPAVVDYAVKRMPRSFEAAFRLVSALDAKTLAEQRKITTAVVRAWLNADDMKPVQSGTSDKGDDDHG